MLPVFPAPEADEVLSSYLIRLALANGLRPTRLTAVLGLPTIWKRDPDLSMTPTEIAEIATVTGYPVERLMQCSVMPLLQQLHRNPQPDSNPRFLVMNGKQQGGGVRHGSPICVACVRESGAVLRTWRLTTSVVCERHGIALVDTCPFCHSPLHHARVHMTRANRMRLMRHAPERCADCGREVPMQDMLDDSRLMAALWVQRAMRQAIETGTVDWCGVELTTHDFQTVLESVLRLHYPKKCATGRSKWRPETSTVRERLDVVVAGGTDMMGGILNLLRTWRNARVQPTSVLRSAGGVPTWFREVVILALSRDARGQLSLLPGRKTFAFTERQWRVIATCVPPMPRRSRHAKAPRHVLQAWLTRNLKVTKQDEWVGQVSYPAMQRRLKRMAVEGMLDQIVERILTDLPECLFALIAPQTVADLFRLNSRHAEYVWELMLNQAIRDSSCRIQ